MTSLLPASSAGAYRSDVEATIRFAEESCADKVFEQHLARRHVYLPEPTPLFERHPQSGASRSILLEHARQAIQAATIHVRFSVWPPLTPSFTRETHDQQRQWRSIPRQRGSDALHVATPHLANDNFRPRRPCGRSSVAARTMAVGKCPVAAQPSPCSRSHYAW